MAEYTCGYCQKPIIEGRVAVVKADGQDTCFHLQNYEQACGTKGAAINGCYYLMQLIKSQTTVFAQIVDFSDLEKTVNKTMSSENPSKGIITLDYSAIQDDYKAILILRRDLEGGKGYFAEVKSEEHRQIGGSVSGSKWYSTPEKILEYLKDLQKGAVKRRQELSKLSSELEQVIQTIEKEK